MGERVDPEIEELLRERKIQRFRATEETILKELEGAGYDLDKARSSLDQGDYKWSTVQAYYSMFHSARALLYSQGYREKSHSALLAALTSLFVRTGLLDRDYIDDLRDAKDARESADYGMVYSEEGAIVERLDAGTDVIVNLSRGALPDARRIFRGMTVLALTARPEVLADRLAGRGREDAGEIAARLSRADRFEVEGEDVIHIDNSGTPAETVAAVRAALYPARV